MHGRCCVRQHPASGLGIVVTPYPPKSDQQLSQFAVKIRNFENFKLGTDFEKAHLSAAVSRIDGSGFPVNVPNPEGVGWRYRLRPLTSAPATGLILKA